MFNTVGKSSSEAGRKVTTLEKLDRMNKALSHQEPDRVPISDFFWGSFIERWRKDLNLPSDANPYYYYDLDWISRDSVKVFWGRGEGAGGSLRVGS